MARPADARSLLPLTPAVFHILLALFDEDRHGFGIAKDIETRTSGRVSLGPGTLYGTLDRMAETGLVEPVKDDGSDARRRYHRITPLGRAAAKAEALRLQELVTIARDKAVLASEKSR